MCKCRDRQIYSTICKGDITAKENFLGFKICILDSLPYSNLSQEEWRAARSLEDGISIVIKKAEKGSCYFVG